MSICFPKYLPEAKLLIAAVGEFEATRDWMENNYEVRTPEQVITKLTNRGIVIPISISATETDQVPSEVKPVAPKEAGNYSVLDSDPSYYHNTNDLLESPAGLNGLLNVIPFEMSVADTQKARGNEFMRKFVNRLSERTGINYSSPRSKQNP
jgi:hypothetical protein